MKRNLGGWRRVDEGEKNCGYGGKDRHESVRRTRVKTVAWKSTNGA
jgi:hypothetical protein